MDKHYSRSWWGRATRALILLCLPFWAQGEEVMYKNLIRMGLDQRIKYERLLGHGFKVGTDMGYRLSIEGKRYFHMDQQPNLWLLTLAHEWELGPLTLENKLSGLGSEGSYKNFKYNLYLLKKIALIPNLDFSPSLNFFQYALETEYLGKPNDDWRLRGYPHQIDFALEIGLNFDWKF